MGSARQKGASEAQRLRRRHELRLRKLIEFSATLNSSLDPARVREAALHAACSLLAAESATLFLVDRGLLSLQGFSGALHRDSLLSLELPMDHPGPAGRCARLRAACVGPGDRGSLACVPLLARGALLGVLQAEGAGLGAAELPLLEALGHQVAIAVDNAFLHQRTREQFHETVMALATAIDAKDRYTGGHTKRVALYSERIARELGLDETGLEEVRLAAILHDVGKIGIEDKVLRKNASLEHGEWEQMRTHPELGWRILSGVASLKGIADGMRFHHERPDGLGYPLGLRGEEIPLIARIISVADTFDAMTSRRPYREALSREAACEEIQRQRGTQFCEKVVDAFARAFKMEGLGKIRGSREGAELEQGASG